MESISIRKTSESSSIKYGGTPRRAKRVSEVAVRVRINEVTTKIGEKNDLEIDKTSLAMDKHGARNEAMRRMNAICQHAGNSACRDLLKARFTNLEEYSSDLQFECTQAALNNNPPEFLPCVVNGDTEYDAAEIITEELEARLSQ